MMTLKRFNALADSYGADLRRWPERARPQARALLESSAEAQASIARARELDEAMAAAAAARGESLWSGDRPEAALMRLRTGVAARISSGNSGMASDRPSIRTVSRAPRRLGWIGLATAASVAIVAGVALGVLYPQGASNQDLLALLQPSPIQLISDSYE
jgi:hypothetical protein